MTDINSSAEAEREWKGLQSPGGPTQGIEGATLASSASVSLAVTHYLHPVSGTAAQVLVDIPYDGFAGTVALRPTGVFTGATGGTATATAKGIGLAFTAVVGKVLFLTYDPLTTLWYPSYTSQFGERSETMETWEPNPGRQEEFLSLPDTFFEAFYGGALGGGKTEAIVMLPITRGFHLNPNYNGIIFRRTFPQLEEHVIPKTRQFYPLFGGKYNETKHIWFFPSGATQRLGYLDSDADVYKHDGAEYNYIGWDELTHFTERMYTYLSTRCRSTHKKSGLPTIMRASGMPGGEGNAWVKKRFIDPTSEGRIPIHYKINGELVSKAIFIPAKMQDNPRLLAEDPNYINRLRMLNEREYLAKAEGNWSAFEGQFFSDFRERRYNNEPANALHVIDPFEIPSWWPRIGAGDWGFSHATSLYKAAIAPNLRVYVYYEYYARGRYIAEWASEFKASCKGEDLKTFELDPSAWQQRGDEKTIAQQFMEQSGIRANQADNDRIGGWMHFRELLRWRPRPPKWIPDEGYNLETANRINRVYGPEKLKEYQKLFLPEPPEKDIPKLQIFKTCKQLIETIPLAVHDNIHPEDVDKFDGDDPIDAARYLFKAVDRYLNGLDREASKRLELGAILNDFEVTGNQTSFYRKMEKFEEKRFDDKRIRLYH